MTKNSKKISAMSGGIGAVAITAATLVATLTPHPVEIPYNIYVESQYVSEMEIKIPQEESVDLVELYVNDSYVDNALMPDGTFKSIPLVFTNHDNLTFKMYNQGEVCGTGAFDENDKLIYTRK